MYPPTPLNRRHFEATTQLSEVLGVGGVTHHFSQFHTFTVQRSAATDDVFHPIAWVVPPPSS